MPQTNNPDAPALTEIEMPSAGRRSYRQVGLAMPLEMYAVFSAESQRLEVSLKQLIWSYVTPHFERLKTANEPPESA